MEATTYTASDGDDDDLYVSQIGEKLTRKVLQRFHRVINGYGTAETVHISTCKILQSSYKEAAEDTDVRIVGRPQPSSTIYILNKRLSIVPIHISGNVYIGGSCLARGYLNLPQLTSEKYISSPFGDGRVYYTGDVGRWTKDGELLVVGRRDSQVKINGFRVELGEIESVASQLSEVDNAIAMYRNNRLYLYWIGILIDIDTIKTHLYKHLPAAMIPNHFVHMSEFPLNANGKVDKLSLPLVDKNNVSSAYSALGRMEACTEGEKKMLTIWKNLLRVDDLGLDGHFFEVGGDSLKLVLLLYQVQAAFDAPLRVSDIYTYDTVSSLATFINNISSSPPQHHSCSSSTSSSTILINSDQHACFVTYYQMYYLLWWFQYVATVRITVTKSRAVDLYDLCNVILKKFPLLKTRLRGYDSALLDLDVSDIYDIVLTELIERENTPIEDYDGTDHCSLINMNGNEELCRLFVSASDNSIILIMHHLLFDGYSVDSLFTFIDQYINDRSIAYEVEDYRSTNAYINRNVVQSYAADMEYWTQILSQRVVGTRTIAMTLPFESSKLHHLNPFQIIQLLNDTLPFPVLFYLETTSLRYSTMGLYSNGCLLCVDKGSTTNIIESVFKANLPHASIPIYLLINRFKLCNMVYINHAVMQYSGYQHIDVAFSLVENGNDDYRGHYPLTLEYYGPDKCKLEIWNNFYYADE